jgi:hypothetical protein
MSRLFHSAFATHLLVTDDGNMSANPNDYWDITDTSFRFTGATLIRTNHAYRTVGLGRIVLGIRPLKEDPTLHDLKRLHRALTSVQLAALTGEPD